MTSARPWTRLDELDLGGRRLLLRAEFNTPLRGGRVGDDSRIRATVPAIRAAHDAGGSVVIMSHLGRPPGKREEKRTLAPVAECLGELLGRPVRFFRDEPGPLGGRSVAAARSLPPGETLLLENLRFHPGETANDPAFAGQLASLGDCYANDAFGVVHRAHASVDRCARLFGNPAAGPLIENEVRGLLGTLDQPARPFVAVVGGSKISDKLPAVRLFARQADRLLIGGPIGYAFLAAQGKPKGWDLYPEEIEGAKAILNEYGGKIALAGDHLVSRDAGGRPAGPGTVLPVTELPEGCRAFDIGPKTRERFAAEIAEAETVFWNGPMGAYKRSGFGEGTRTVLVAMGEAAERKATTVVGGGHTVGLVRAAGIGDRMTHLSTGGGAMLALLAGQPLPGLKALGYGL